MQYTRNICTLKRTLTALLQIIPKALPFFLAKQRGRSLISNGMHTDTHSCVFITSEDTASTLIHFLEIYSNPTLRLTCPPVMLAMNLVILMKFNDLLYQDFFPLHNGIFKTDSCARHTWNISTHTHTRTCKYIYFYSFAPTLTRTVCVLAARWRCAAVVIRPQVRYLKTPLFAVLHFLMESHTLWALCKPSRTLSLSSCEKLSAQHAAARASDLLISLAC